VHLPIFNFNSIRTRPPSARTPQAFAGIVTVSVGHCHPTVTEAITRQSQLLQHTTTIYLNPHVAEYAKELADRMPGNLPVL
jgi:alanine-glyoxylate transaminase/(R)-3-amino-2-methylpropionate-pyruvate transaminase